MGVDYRAHAGVGIQVEVKEVEGFEYFNEYLEDALDLEKYFFFESGEGAYSGEDNDYFICIEQPFTDGLINLNKLKDDLLTHLSELEIEVKGVFDVQVGLEVW
jgi:hypothetical protein